MCNLKTKWPKSSWWSPYWAGEFRWYWCLYICSNNPDSAHSFFFLMRCSHLDTVSKEDQYFRLTMQMVSSHWDALYSDRLLQKGHASFQNPRSWPSHKTLATCSEQQDLGEQTCGTQGMPFLMLSGPKSRSDHWWWICGIHLWAE